ncbi:MAG TPA: tetratricopeptide repeat protein [Spirochaetota bacterium]|nr:tetratricopeptide repeat protein [Spirochaetota bacterium]
MKNIKLIILIAIAAISLEISAEIPDVLYHLNDRGEIIGHYSIYAKNDILFCSGDDPAGSENNRAAELMMIGEFNAASEVFEDALRHAPLFLPFRYNLGICYLYLNKLDLAMMHFTKAKQLVPEYDKIYLQIGYIYDRKNDETRALDYFSKALQLNPNELNTYILIGDIYFKRNQMNIARKYYEKALKINPVYPNGLLGLAKIHFKKEEYIKAIVLFKSINTGGDYDKSLHFYYAESSFKLGDYRKAAEEYEKLLSFRNDRFFLVNSVLLIKHKLDLSRRFIE